MSLHKLVAVLLAELGELEEEYSSVKDTGMKQMKIVLYFGGLERRLGALGPWRKAVAEPCWPNLKKRTGCRSVWHGFRVMQTELGRNKEVVVGSSAWCLP